MTDRAPGFSTLAVHAGAQPDPTTGARVTPIYQTTAFVFDDVDHAASLFGLQAFGNIYSRLGNPTCSVLEERVAALEGGTAALAVASGHAAEHLVFHTLLEPGDEFVAAKKLYGGSINQFNHAYKKFGWNVVWADEDAASFERAITPKTKAIFIESIANPGGAIFDIAGIAAVAKKAGIPLIVDNTLASPYLIRPFEHGADIVVHSATKFLGGHGNSIGGVIVDGGTFDWIKAGKRYPSLTAPRPEYAGMVLGETFGNFAFAIACRVLGLRDLGPALSPFNAFQILTGIETLPLRMQKHSDNALAVAKFLAKHPEVSWVSYAGLEGDKYHALAKRYTPKGAGAVFTFGVKGGNAAGIALVANLKLFSHVANVGDTRSLVIHPASTTHRQLTGEQKIASGAGPDVVRLSVGIEDVEDLIADLDQALKN